MGPDCKKGCSRATGQSKWTRGFIRLIRLHNSQIARESWIPKAPAKPTLAQGGLGSFHPAWPCKAIRREPVVLGNLEGATRGYKCATKRKYVTHDQKSGHQAELWVTNVFPRQAHSI